MPRRYHRFDRFRGSMIPLETIREAPKALLHDHLDGGLRPETIVDLAGEHGYTALPTTDPAELARWIRRGADRKSLELYLETFAHTVGVMQDRDAPGRPVRRGRRMCRALAGRRRRRLRRGGPRAWLPADALPRCLRVHPPGELPHHDPRRRIVRAAVDLGGAPV